MTYYKVKPEFDQHFIPRSGYTLLWGELFTARELRKIHVPAYMVTTKELSPRDTFTAWGCRLEKNDPNPWRG